MRRRFFLLIFLLLTLAACGGKSSVAPEMPRPAPAEDPSKVTWNADPGGLRLRIDAASDLNTQDGAPLALSLCVYQIDDAKRFNGLAQSADGLDALQACTVEAAAAASAKRFWLQPGQQQVVDLDRAEGAKTLAVAAGYAHLKPELSAATFRYLLHQEKEGYIPGFRKTVHSAAQMEIAIRLTASQVSLNGVEREQ
ncbi:MAG: type VI secretion system lipoprotein TssJ [Candidatus Accumulibacter sp.]|jgi:type VI secretion system VasD/TssJ family lipoprotein|nr:type VI secretion system lipoprotein TssJ [Accumulibacter sp.]